MRTTSFSNSSMVGVPVNYAMKVRFQGDDDQSAGSQETQDGDQKTKDGTKKTLWDKTSAYGQKATGVASEYGPGLAKVMGTGMMATAGYYGATQGMYPLLMKASSLYANGVSKLPMSIQTKLLWIYSHHSAFSMGQEFVRQELGKGAKVVIENSPGWAVGAFTGTIGFFKWIFKKHAKPPGG